MSINIDGSLNGAKIVIHFYKSRKAGTIMAIVAVRKNEDGDNVEFKLDTGDIISVESAIAMCEAGELPGYNVGTSKAGTKFIRGNADGDESNNLDSLPTF